jgi:Fic family protein
MENKLDSQERKELLLQHKKEKDSRVCDRIKVVIWRDDGLTLEEIAKLLFIDKATVRRHLQDYQENLSLNPGHKGSQPILNILENYVLTQHLKRSCLHKG